jgi:hypothetical protein
VGKISKFALWEKESKAGHGADTSGPFSVTKIVKDRDQDAAIREAKARGSGGTGISTYSALFINYNSNPLGYLLFT